jgi:hypothetical protein
MRYNSDKRCVFVYRLTDTAAHRTVVGMPLSAVCDVASRVGVGGLPRRLLPKRAILHSRGRARTALYKGWLCSRLPRSEWSPGAEGCAAHGGEVTLVLPFAPLAPACE